MWMHLLSAGVGSNIRSCSRYLAVQQGTHQSLHIGLATTVVNQTSCTQRHRPYRKATSIALADLVWTGLPAQEQVPGRSGYMVQKQRPREQFRGQIRNYWLVPGEGLEPTHR